MCGENLEIRSFTWLNRWIKHCWTGPTLLDLLYSALLPFIQHEYFLRLGSGYFEALHNVTLIFRTQGTPQTILQTHFDNRKIILTISVRHNVINFRAPITDVHRNLFDKLEWDDARYFWTSLEMPQILFSFVDFVFLERSDLNLIRIFGTQISYQSIDGRLKQITPLNNRQIVVFS